MIAEHISQTFFLLITKINDLSNKTPLAFVINMMHRYSLRGFASFIIFVFALTLAAQERKVQNRPYIDQRRFHYGFLLGLHMQDMEVENNKHAVYHEQKSGADSTQVFKSTYISVPIDVKFAAPRYNNFRPYLIAGLNPMVDLTARKHNALRLKPFDLYLEVGMGCDIYLPFFKLIPEIKFCFGLLDIIQKDRSDLIDGTLLKYTKSVNGGHSNMIVLTLNFE